MRVLFVGDVVGAPGRRGLEAKLAELRERHEVDLAIVNGENAAGGVGINERSAREIFAAGADLITLGNHAYRQRDSYELLDREERIVRPANYPRGNPGRGSTIVEAAGRKVGVLNLSGALQLTVARAPFPAADAELAELQPTGRRGADRRLPRRGDEREGGDRPATSTVASAPCSAPTRTCRRPTGGCFPAVPPSSPTSA